MGPNDFDFEGKDFLKDVYAFIKEKAKEEEHVFSDNNPAKIESNPLLADFDYIYQHAEYLFCFCVFDYQNYQKTDQYFTLFKALSTNIIWKRIIIHI